MINAHDLRDTSAVCVSPNKEISLPFLGYLCLLAMAGFVAADMSLPAFPEMTTAFATDEAHIGWSFSAFLLGMALGQPLHGYLADHLGRRRTLLLGMTAFVFSTVCCMLTHNVWWLIFWRFIQALGICAGNVVWQSIAINKFSPATSQRVFGIATAGLSVSPALAPVLGGYLNSHLGFEAIFIVLLVMGIFLLVVSAWWLEVDELAVHFEINRFFNNYRHILGSAGFRASVLHLSCATSIYFVYLTGSPFILANFGYSSTEIGYSYIPQTLMFMLGCGVCQWMQQRFGLHRVLWIHAIWTIAVLLVMAMVYAAGHLSGGLMIIIFASFAFINGLTQPVLLARVARHFKGLAGSAAGLAGAIQALIFFLSSSIAAGLVHIGTGAIIACMMVLSMIIVAIVWLGAKNILLMQSQ